MKNLMAFTFDSRLPRVSLEYFLTYETEGASAKWIIRGCDGLSTDRNADPRRNSPICVQADFALNDGGALAILIRVEKSPNENFGDPHLVSLTVTKSTGKVRQIRSLCDLPMELHRWPSRTPRDLPLPGRAS